MSPRSNILLEPFTIGDQTTPLGDYHLFLGVVGYEDRAGHLVRRYGRALAQRRFALAFSDNHVLNFDSNMQCALDADIQVEEVPDDGVEDALDTMTGANTMQLGMSPLKVFLDTSSMTRSMLARVLWWMRTSLPYGSTIDAAYCVAEYTPGLADHGPVTESGPLPHCAGWAGTPDLELAMCVGLGFEAHLALGVLEAHEPSAIWCFAPSGIDDRYDSEMESLNGVLLNEIHQRNVLRYSVLDPFGLCVALYDVATLAQSRYRVTVVPLGPKVFCLAAIAVAMTLGGRLGIWRVSAGGARIPVDRHASGAVVGLRLKLVGEPALSRRSVWSLSAAELVAQLA